MEDGLVLIVVMNGQLAWEIMKSQRFANVKVKRGVKMSNELWDYNSVQFPRLIAEIAAIDIGEEAWDELLTSMDIESEDLSELFDRAQEEWEAIKNRHCPPSLRN